MTITLRAAILLLVAATSVAQGQDISVEQIVARHLEARGGAERLKALKLTIRNAPLQQPESFAPCLFSGAPGVEEILIGRAY